MSDPLAAGRRKPHRQARIPLRAAVAQLARASACHAEGRGFESLQPLFRECLHVGGLGLAMAAETRSNHPRISPPFQALVPEMPWMRAACADSALH